jgi:hypothetical protein
MAILMAWVDEILSSPADWENSCNSEQRAVVRDCLFPPSADFEQSCDFTPLYNWLANGARRQLATLVLVSLVVYEFDSLEPDLCTQQCGTKGLLPLYYYSYPLKNVRGKLFGMMRVVPSQRCSGVWWRAVAMVELRWRVSLAWHVLGGWVAASCMRGCIHS